VKLDHVAHPCASAAASHRFYAEVLGLPLAHAWAGEQLMLVYALPGGGA
jgi:catechol 2,3-dioxygenase-like lactoylglutathione lyase family enzyme